MRRLVVIFYAAFAAVAVIWGIIAGRPNVLWLGELPPLRVVLGHASIGVGIGLLIVGISSIATSMSESMQELSGAFSQILGELSWADAFLFAILSGIAEEMLFRGAMQPDLGLFLTSLIFGLVHFPMDKRFAAWPIFAFLTGLLLGYLTEQTQNIAGAAAAHFTINFLNLKWMTEA